MKPSYVVILLCLISCLVAGCAIHKNSDPVRIVKIPESELKYLPDARFDKFVVNNSAAFKQFDKIIFFPVQFDKLKISHAADKKLAESWNKSNWDEMDAICQQFDDFAIKIFSERDGFTPTNRGGTDVLAIEFSLIEFMPYAKRYKDAGMDTVGSSSDSSGIGELTVRGVLANAKTGELVAVIEDTMQVNARSASSGNLASQYDSTNRSAQNAAWRVVFRHWITDLHKELTQLKSAPLAAQ